jgi:hypothetical protein
MHDTDQMELIAVCFIANVTNWKPKYKVAVKCYPNRKVGNANRIVYDYTFNKQIKCILGALHLQCKRLRIRSVLHSIPAGVQLRFRLTWFTCF